MPRHAPSRLVVLLGTAGLAALFGGTPRSEAYTITTGGTAAIDGSGPTSAVGTETILTFDSLLANSSGSFTYDGVTFSGSGEIVAGSSTNQYVAPSGDGTNYLVAGGSPSYTGSETLTVSGPSSNYFGLYWGSLSNDNTLTFLSGGNAVATITGSQVAAANGGNGNPIGVGSNDYVNIFDLPGYDTVVLSTTAANFEVDNIAFGAVIGAVPEPGTLALVGVGLFGLGMIHRRRRSRFAISLPVAPTQYFPVGK